MNICTTCPFQSLGNDLITNINLPPIPVDSKRKGQNIAGSSQPKTKKIQNATSQINASTSAQPNTQLISQLSNVQLGAQSSSTSSTSIPSKVLSGLKTLIPWTKNKHVQLGAQSSSASSSSIPKPNMPSVPTSSPSIPRLNVPSVPKQFPENEILERPRYYFSKNQWTFDKEQALEQLLMK